MRFAIVPVLVFMTLASPGSAQVLSTPPKGVILPNYDLVRIGQWEAIESGAVVARTTGPLANVYNPAGLAAADKTEINGSSTGYQLTRLGLTGVGRDVSSSRLANLGGFLGVALADPVIKSKNWRLGFSVFSPLGWEPGTLAGADLGLVGGSERGIEYRTQVRLKADVPSFAAGLTVAKGVRLGVGLQVPIVHVLQEQQTVSLDVTGADATQVNRAFAADGSVWLARATMGLQWDLSKAVTLGLTVESPTARLFGSSFYSDELTRSQGIGFQSSSFRDPSARMDYKLPFLLAGGAAFRQGKVQLEGNVRWYSSVSQFNLYQSDSVGIAVIASGTEAPVTLPVVLAPVTLNYQSVVNVSVGAQMRLSRGWALHAGFNTDQSPLPNVDEIFRKASLWGATAGVSFTISSLTGAVGFGLQSGKSPSTTVGIPPNQRDTQLTVRTFQLMYSVAYSF